MDDLSRQLYYNDVMFCVSRVSMKRSKPKAKQRIRQLIGRGWMAEMAFEIWEALKYEAQSKS